jgi:hypothetical protein
LRYERMSGLDEEQLGELEYCVAELLEEPWDKGEGRPHELTLREALTLAFHEVERLTGASTAEGAPDLGR